MEIRRARSVAEVAEPYRRRGIGRAPVGRLAALGRERGCYGMWVLTDAGNDVALAASAVRAARATGRVRW
ncbi:GNAT family N-acetyltransferase [Streptomyces sp. NPDC004542]|uniref:GNAT family N-acetyltransferase n=1 Tax=Streptomyces sp. NPDC004542 TaxID=3154281 RepID=UPI0033A6BC15